MDSSARPVDQPTLSIVVPIWNTTRSELLTSHLVLSAGQREESFEVVIVDDGSTDPGTTSLLEALSAAPHVRVVRLEHNLGPGGARDAGLAEARGQWVAFLDSDDSCDLAALLTAVSSSNPAETDIVVVDYWWLEQGASTFVASAPRMQPDMYDLLERRPAVWRMAFSRKFLDRIPSFPRLRYGEDLCFLLQAAASDPRVSYRAGLAAVTYHCPSPARSPAVEDRAALVQELGRLRRQARTARARALIDSWALRVIVLALRDTPSQGLRIARGYPVPGVREVLSAVDVAVRSRRR